MTDTDDLYRIDTQRELLGDDKNIKRFIEIGPAKVLTTLAKKSADKLVGEKDLLTSNNREFLFVGDENDSRKINYEYESNINDTAPQDTGKIETAESNAPSSTPETGKVPAPVKAPVNVSAPVQATPAAAKVADVDLTPTDIILALVAQKLRKVFDEVPGEASIRSLSSGKYNDVRLNYLDNPY
jgi:fatty acid synthase subunit alpha